MKTCEVCGKRLRKTQARYCSHSCMGKATAKPKPILTCLVCGNQFESKYATRYCSPKCVGKARIAQKDNHVPAKVESYVSRTLSTRTERMQTYRADTITVIPRGLVKCWNPLRHCYYIAEIGTIR